MLIRCEKCSTTYELEERRIPPGGAPVQCSRCEHVFRAYPPSRIDGEGVADAERRPGLELVPPPANDLPEDAAPPPEPPVGAGPEPRALPAYQWPPAAPGESAEPAPVATADTEPAAEPAPVAPPYAAVTKTPAPAVTKTAPPAVTKTPAPASVPASVPVPATVPATGDSGSPAAPAIEAGASEAQQSAGSAPRTSPSTYKPPPGPVIPPGKPVRKVPNPELEGTDVPSVGTMPRRAMSFDVGKKKRGKSSWIVTGAVGLLGLLVVAGLVSWWQEQRAARTAQRAAAASSAAAAPAPSRAVARERQEAMKLLIRDDAASLERAAAQLDDVVRREPASAARADRALALALLSQQARDEADRLESRARSLDEEVARAGSEGAPRADLAAEADTARAEVAPLRERSGRLLSEARAELDALSPEAQRDAAATRARAWVQLESGARADAARTAHAAPGAAEDPWLSLAAALADLPEGASGEVHERVAERLEQLAAQHPDFVRPLLLAGRIRAGLGDGERALADFDGVLKVNPQHVEARRVRAEISPPMPESDGAATGAGAPADGAKPSGASPAVNGRSQGGKARTAPPGR
ncbi:MAG TPA: zinc-ribbon domain-containing protein [Anaeromyxobacteraceae bacterium]|nr:zinc-ribbon domain-containing protein [Anaeromyxobacteraceae bacterium]